MSEALISILIFLAILILIKMADKDVDRKVYLHQKEVINRQSKEIEILRKDKEMKNIAKELIKILKEEEYK